MKQNDFSTQNTEIYNSEDMDLQNSEQIINDANEEMGERNRYADMMNKSRRKLPKPIKIGLTVLVIGGLIAGGVYGVKRTKKTAETEQPATAFAQRGSLETYIEGDGSIEARKQVELGKDLKGKVTNIAVDIGQAVKTGDLLFSVDPTELKKDIDTNKKSLQDAQRSLDEAVSAVTSAQKSVSELTTTAPFSGKFLPQKAAEGETQKTYRNGDEISGGTVIGTMVDDTVMRLPLYFSYAYVDSITKGAKANISIPASMSQITGWVDSVEKVEKISESGTRLFRVVIAMNNAGTLTSGMVASAEVQTANGNIMPAESGKLEYSREEAVTVKQSGEITSIGTLDYYRFPAGAVLVRQKNDELTRAVETANRNLQTQQQAIADKQKQIAELEAQVANANVTSPIDGIVVKMDTAVDAELAGGTAPCVVADMSSLVVKAQISMNDVNSVAAGQPASITLQTGSEDMTLTGTVESVALQANENTGNGSMPTYTATILLDPLPENVSVSMGYYVSYKITTATADDCIVVPAKAVVNTQDGTAVFAKAPEGEKLENAQPVPEGAEGVPEGFKLVPVKIGISDSDNVEILSGITEGTEVFIAGPQDMYEQSNSSGVIAVG